MTMTDDDLEVRVRSTLRAVAAATPVADAPVARPIRLHRDRRPLLAAAAVLAVLAVVGVMVSQRDGRPVGLASGPPIVPLPANLSLEHGPPLFTPARSASVDDAAAAYVADRLGDDAPALTLAPAVVDGVTARVRWRSDVTTGAILLRQSSSDGAGTGQWWVVAAATDSVDASTVVHEDGRVRGRVRTNASLPLDVTVSNVDGKRLGGGTGEGAVDLDVRVGRDEALVVVRLVADGHPASITELRLDLPMPTERRQLASGTWAGGGWRLVASGRTESEMVCLGLELDVTPGSVSVCSTGDEPLPNDFVSLGGAAPVDGEVLLHGQVGPDVARVVARIPGHADVEGPAYQDPLHPNRQGYAVLAVPAVDDVEVEAFDADGHSLGRVVVHPLTGKRESFTPTRS